MFGGFGGFGGIGGFGQQGGPGAFNQTFKCFPSSFYAAQKAGIDPEEYENSDRILLPPSAMQMLAQLKIDYPMLFELIPHNGSKHLHCGVLEFVAEEGFVYVPFWMMENMHLDEGDLLTVRNASLPKGSFVKFRPQSTNFINLANPRAVLEKKMSKFACLTKSQTIRIFYNNKTYDLDVVQLQAAGKDISAVSIIEADINVDFEAPADYVDPVTQPESIQANVGQGAQLFKAQDKLSLAADRGCIAIASSVFIEDGIRPPNASPSSGQKLSGKAVKRSSALKSQGVAMSDALLEHSLTVGVYSSPSEHVALWAADGVTDGQVVMPSLIGAPAEGEGMMGQTLRAAKTRR